MTPNLGGVEDEGALALRPAARKLVGLARGHHGAVAAMRAEQADRKEERDQKLHPNLVVEHARTICQRRVHAIETHAKIRVLHIAVDAVVDLDTAERVAKVVS